jgi:serine/threonine-protein kinase
VPIDPDNLTRWTRARTLFDAAADLPVDQRQAYLEANCTDDAALCAEVLSWLEAESGPDRPIAEAVARVASSLTDFQSVSPGTLIGPYALDRELAHGGMGTVYLAHRADDEFERAVAVKVIRGWADEDVLRRFRVERQILADLDHSNIARLIDGGATPAGLPFLVMEYVDGQTLSQHCDERALTVHERVALLETLCRAVHYAHERGVIHRDLKPGNVLVTKDGTAKLIDFGIARLFSDEGAGHRTTLETLPGRGRMTPEYASPEQVLGRPITTTSDVYVLGLLLYEVLTGVRPQATDTGAPEDVVRAVVETTPPRPSEAATTEVRRHIAKSLSGDLDTIVLKALEKSPDRRYSSAAALADDLQRYLNGEPVLARAASVTYILRRRLRRHWRASAVAATFAALVVAQSTYWFVQQGEQRRQVESAVQLGQQVERVGLDLRVEQGLPLHDTRPARARVLARIAEIEQQMPSLQPAAQATAQYAIGRGYLALGANADARDALAQAWESGYRTADVSSNLGLALSRLYGEAVREINSGGTPDLRAARRAVVDRSLRDPAVQYLRLGGSDPDVAMHTAGLVSFLEGDLDEALAQAAEARSRIAWLHETLLLEGDVALQRAVSFVSSGRYPAARDAVTLASDRYQQAVRVAASDPVPYQRLCGLGAIQIGLNLDAGGGVEAGVADAIQYCRQAGVADPDLAQPHVDLARLYWNLGTFQRRNGRDPIPTLQLAIDSAAAALERDPANAKAYLHLGTAWQQRGAHEYGTGADPRASLAAAVDAYGEAMRLGLDDASLHNSLANAHAYLGDWLRQEGLDPRDAITLAIDEYRKAADREPANALPHGNLGIAYKDLAMYEASRGRDSMSLLQQSVEAYNAALQRNPNHAPTLNNLAQSWYRIGLAQFSRGQDPEGSFAQADNAADRALTINPTYATPMVNRAEIALGRSAAITAAGGDPTAVLERARTSLRQALAINPNNRSQFYAHSARVELAEARWRVAGGQDAAKAVAAARGFAIRMRQVNPGDADGWELLSQAGIVEARFRMREGLSPAAALTSARLAIEEARTAYPDAPWYMETSLALTLCRVDSELDGPADTITALTTATALAERALETRPGHARTTALGAVLAAHLGRLADAPEQRAEAQRTLAAVLKSNPHLRLEFERYL